MFAYPLWTGSAAVHALIIAISFLDIKELSYTSVVLACRAPSCRMRLMAVSLICVFECYSSVVSLIPTYLTPRLRIDLPHLVRLLCRLNCFVVYRCIISTWDHNLGFSWLVGCKQGATADACVCTWNTSVTIKSFERYCAARVEGSRWSSFDTEPPKRIAANDGT